MRIFDFLKDKKKKHILVWIAAAVGVAVVLYIYVSGGDAPSFDSVVAARGAIVQEVSITGRVKPSESVDLAFENGGKLAWLGVRVGEAVRSGQTLAELQNADIAARRAQADAQVKIQKAELEKLLAGTRQEDIAVEEVKLRNTEAAYEDAKRNLTTVLYDSYTKSDDAVRNKTDQFFTNPRSSNPEINFLISDGQLKTDIITGRTLIEPVFLAWESDVNALVSSGDPVSFVSRFEGRLEQVKLFLNKVASAVNALTASAGFSQTTIDRYKADVASARTNVNAVTTSLASAFEKLKTAESAVALQKQELALTKAPVREEDIVAQRARVEEAEASAWQYAAELSKTVIRAPFSGVVTKREGRVGEIILANTPVVSVISSGAFEIEAYMPEADVAKVAVGSPARVTLDAYGDDVVFGAHIVSIELAGTLIDGVATYKTRLQFDAKDERIRAGMTANTDIIAGERENVVRIPARAVLAADGRKIVRVLIDGTLTEVPVSVGLRGSDGYVEIIDGVREGDIVVTFSNK